jgi:choline dehydrogenase
LNASQAFIKPVRNRKNLTVLTGAIIDRLVINDSRCEGISFSYDGQQQIAIAEKEVLLSAGSIGSVQILERSGVGDEKRLQPLNIPVVKHLPGVGENLQDHLQIRLVYKVSGLKTLNTLASRWWGKLLIGLQYALTRSGPMSMAPSQLGAFAHSSSTHARPNIQYHVQPLSLDKFGDPLHSFNAFTTSVCNLRPSSRGSVHITSKELNEAPAINPNYLATGEDRQVALDALRFTRTIMQQKAFDGFDVKEFRPGLSFNTDEELLKQIGEIATTIFHPVGTCKMGKPNDPMAVVDSQLRVIGIHGLRVIDASVMPTITSGNTAAPTMMIAQKIADQILADNE